jgi:hypothetical protein
MSTTGATVHTTNAVSLANEEEVNQVLLNSVLGLWDVGRTLPAAQAVPARSLSCHDLRSAQARGKRSVEKVSGRQRGWRWLHIITGGGARVMQAANEAPPPRRNALSPSASALIYP